MCKSLWYIIRAFSEFCIFLGTTIFATLLALHFYDTNFVTKIDVAFYNNFWYWILMPAIFIIIKTWADYNIDN